MSTRLTGVYVWTCINWGLILTCMFHLTLAEGHFFPAGRWQKKFKWCNFSIEILILMYGILLCGNWVFVLYTFCNWNITAQCTTELIFILIKTGSSEKKHVSRELVYKHKLCLFVVICLLYRADAKEPTIFVGGGFGFYFFFTTESKSNNFFSKFYIGFIRKTYLTV